jgi:hypothetical protein
VFDEFCIQHRRTNTRLVPAQFDECRARRLHAVYDCQPSEGASKNRTQYRSAMGSICFRRPSGDNQISLYNHVIAGVPVLGTPSSWVQHSITAQELADKVLPHNLFKMDEMVAESKVSRPGREGFIRGPPAGVSHDPPAWKHGGRWRNRHRGRADRRHYRPTLALMLR